MDHWDSTKHFWKNISEVKVQLVRELMIELMVELLMKLMVELIISSIIELFFGGVGFGCANMIVI